jgi:hypothetical protein
VRGRERARARECGGARTASGGGARTASGGGVWTASDGGARTARRRGVEWKRKREQMGREPAREKYDMWTPQKFLSPVDPTLRF